MLNINYEEFTKEALKIFLKNNFPDLTRSFTTIREEIKDFSNGYSFLLEQILNKKSSINPAPRLINYLEPITKVYKDLTGDRKAFSAIITKSQASEDIIKTAFIIFDILAEYHDSSFFKDPPHKYDITLSEDQRNFTHTGNGSAVSPLPWQDLGLILSALESANKEHEDLPNLFYDIVKKTRNGIKFPDLESLTHCVFQAPKSAIVKNWILDNISLFIDENDFLKQYELYRLLAKTTTLKNDLDLPFGQEISAKFQTLSREGKTEIIREYCQKKYLTDPTDNNRQNLLNQMKSLLDKSDNEFKLRNECSVFLDLFYCIQNNIIDIGLVKSHDIYKSYEKLIPSSFQQSPKSVLMENLYNLMKDQQANEVRSIIIEKLQLLFDKPSSQNNFSFFPNPNPNSNSQLNDDTTVTFGPRQH